MEISMRSLKTGRIQQRDIPIRFDDWRRYNCGEPLEVVAPYLSKEENLFIRTGITEEESQEGET